MKKWNLIVDVAKCNNCANCQVAHMDEYQGNSFAGYSAPMAKEHAGWIEIKRKERGSGTHIDVAYVPVMCQHCDSAPCMKDNEGIIRKREDGIVLIDPELAKGRKDLVSKCPYGSIYWNESLQLPQAWTFDAHLLDNGWQQTRGEQACPTRAFRSVKLSDADMAALAKNESLEFVRPDLSTQPRVYYKNLYRYNTRFIAGTVISVDSAGRKDCLVGTKVDLHFGSRVYASTQTDVFGDFKFDRLPDESATFKVVLSHPAVNPGYHKEVSLDQAGVSLGEITLPGL